jgi:hypothetical protein
MTSAPIPFSLINEKLSFSTIESFGSYGTISLVDTIEDVNKNIILVNAEHQIIDSSYNAIDSSGTLLFNYDSNNPSPDIRDARIDDRNAVLHQQRLLYVMAGITAATLIIAAIIINRNK